MHLDLDGSLSGLALLLNASLGLGADDATTPVASGILVLIGVALLDGSEELGELGLIFGADLSDSQDCSSLLHRS